MRAKCSERAYTVFTLNTIDYQLPKPYRLPSNRTYLIGFRSMASPLVALSIAPTRPETRAQPGRGRLKVAPIVMMSDPPELINLFLYAN
jgi:hypothetical protein